MGLSRKKIAEVVEYDPNDCVSAGWKWTLYSDWHVAVEYRSCWSGSRSGQRYVSEADEMIVDASETPQEALEYYVKEFGECITHQFNDGELAENYRRTQAGFVIQ